jgi:hypothetical protein
MKLSRDTMDKTGARCFAAYHGTPRDTKGDPNPHQGGHGYVGYINKLRTDEDCASRAGYVDCVSRLLRDAYARWDGKSKRPWVRNGVLV